MDEKMRYEGAIEESAKALSNTVDAIREGGRAVGPAIGSICGLLIGDKVEAARKRRLDELARETKKILDGRDVKERMELPEDIAIPLLESAQGETRKEIQEIWARLLANAMDPARAEDVRPEFIVTIRLLSPIDAAVLAACPDPAGNPPMLADHEAGQRLGRRVTAVRTSFAHLGELKCGIVPSNAASIILTNYGVELRYAVRS